MSDSEPVCRAVLVATELAGSAMGMDVSHGLSDALYLQGRDPGAAETVHGVAAAAGLDGDEVIRSWRQPGTAQRLQEHWAGTRASGLSTYPTIAVRSGSGTAPAVVGFATSADIVDTVTALL